MTFFFINSKPLWKDIFSWCYSYISTGLLNKQKQPFTDVLQNRHSLKFRNNHTKTLVLESLFNKVAELKGCSFIKQRLQHRYFHVNIAKFLRTAFFIKHLRWLLLNKVKTNLKSTWFNRDLNRGCLVYIFSLRFSGSKFLINLRRQFRERKIFRVRKFFCKQVFAGFAIFSFCV